MNLAEIGPDPLYLGPIHRRILSTGPIHADPSTLVIDAKNMCFWRGKERRPVLGLRCRRRHKRLFRLVSALVLSMPDMVPWDVIANHLYDDCEGGGPVDLHKSIQVRVWLGRDLFRWMGLRAVNVCRQGYYVEPIDAHSFIEPVEIDMGAMPFSAPTTIPEIRPVL